MELRSCVGGRGNGCFGDEVVAATSTEPAEQVTLSMWLDAQGIPNRWRSPSYRSRISELLVPVRFAEQAAEAIREARESEADPDELERQALSAAPEQLQLDSDADSRSPEEDPQSRPEDLQSWEEDLPLAPSDQSLGTSDELESQSEEVAAQAPEPPPPSMAKAILLACLLTFGRGHAHARAPVRAMVLGVSQMSLLLLAAMFWDPRYLYASLIPVALDVVGAVRLTAGQAGPRKLNNRR